MTIFKLIFNFFMPAFSKTQPFVHKYQNFFSWIVVFFGILKSKFVSIANCADSEDPESSQVGESSSSERKFMSYYTKLYSHNENNQWSTGIETGFEWKDEGGKYCCKRYRYKIPVEEIVYIPTAGAATLYYTRVLTGLLKKHVTHLPIYRVAPVYALAALSAGGAYLGFRALVQSIFNLDEIAELIRTDHPKYSVEIIEEGDIQDMSHVDKFYITTNSEQDLVQGSGNETQLELSAESNQFDKYMDSLPEIKTDIDSRVSEITTTCKETLRKTISSTDSPELTTALRKSLSEVDDLIGKPWISPLSSPTERGENIRLGDSRDYGFKSLDLSEDREPTVPTGAITVRDTYDTPPSPPSPFSALEPTLPDHHLNVAIGSGLGLIIISLICMLWIRLSYSFPDLKNTKPYLLNKYSLVRKLNAYYESLSPEELRTFRLIYITISIYSSFMSFMILWKVWSILRIFYFK